MKVLLCSLDGAGLWFGWLLQHEGHKVDWTYVKPRGSNAMEGLMPPPRERFKATDYDLIVFDSTDMGEAADSARAAGVPVIGDSAVADALEDDRLFGLEVMERAGIRVPKWEAFDDIGKATEWLHKTHKRTVLKPFDDVPKELTYVSKSEDDMRAFMETHASKLTKFVLQEFVTGTEVSTEAWWDGERFTAFNHDLEEKKLMNDNIGPATGCSGNLVWMPPRPNPLFQQGLEKVSPFLVDVGYRGVIDLNCIVTEGVAYGLEWTPRFGYEGACNLTRLLPMPWGEFLYNVATGHEMPNMESRHRFCATTRLSVPPYPLEAKSHANYAHQPIKGLQAKDFPEFFVFSDVHLEGDQLVCCDWGYLGTPLGVGGSIVEAFGQCEAWIKRLEVPDLQWRTDIQKCVTKRYNTLQAQGWLKLI